MVHYALLDQLRSQRLQSRKFYLLFLRFAHVNWLVRHGHRPVNGPTLASSSNRA
jgi:hypothetical protein